MKRMAFFIAWRYLFSKKSHNAINIVSGISAAGVCVGAAALVCVLSVLNGFNSLVEQMFSAFDPDLKITAVEGKNFHTGTEVFGEIKNHPNVACFSETIEENALVRFTDKQVPATIKGVDSVFTQLTQIDSIITSGKFTVYDGAFERCVAGVGLAHKLGLSAFFIDPVKIYAPKRSGQISLLRPERSFNESSLFIAGLFSVQQVQYDDEYMLVSLGLARSLFDYEPDQVTAVELKLKNPADIAKTQKELRVLLGDEYNVYDRYEQQEDFFRIMKVEKWMTFLILAFILLIAIFNIIGSLSMLIIDKQNDIEILRNLGAEPALIKSIFLLEGWLISGCGAVIGIVVGVVLCLLQQTFGFLRLGSNYVIDAYPVQVQAGDVLLILCTVLLLGFLAAWYPTKYIQKRNQNN